MEITPLIASDRQVIQNYRGGQFRIAGNIYLGPVLVQPAQTSEWNVLPAPDNLTAEDFVSRLDQQDRPDIILFGSGRHQVFLSKSVQEDIKASYGLHIEAMSTDAACRTFNVLLSEDRRVAAFLLPFTSL